jgi:hypothetical protein
MKLLCAAVACIALSGCAGYKLGPTNGIPAGSRSVQVNVLQNKVLEESRISEIVTSAVRKQLQQDGTFRLATHNDGDIIVNGSIVRYDRSGLSYQPRDILTPRDYRLNMWALVEARDRSTGKVLLNKRVRGHTTIRIGSDLNTVERQSIPLAAEDLARNITALLSDGEW